MAYCCVLTVSIMCTDNHDQLLVKFHLNEFPQIFVADSLGLHCCSHCIVALLTVLGRNVCVLLCVMWHV